MILVALSVLAVGLVLAGLRLAVIGQLSVLTKQIARSTTDLSTAVNDAALLVAKSLIMVAAEHKTAMAQVAEEYRPIIVVFPYGTVQNEEQLAESIAAALAKSKTTKH